VCGVCVVVECVCVCVVVVCVCVCVCVCLVCVVVVCVWYVGVFEDVCMCEGGVSAWESGYRCEGRGRLIMHDSNTNLTPCSEKEMSRRTMRSPPSKSQSKKQLAYKPAGQLQCHEQPTTHSPGSVNCLAITPTAGVIVG